MILVVNVDPSDVSPKKHIDDPTLLYYRVLLVAPPPLLIPAIHVDFIIIILF